jgi:vacuolar-type H+-ATPase subunit E/Vma4
MKPLGSLAALLAAIRDDAAAEVEAIQRDADAAVARLAADDAACPPPPGGDTPVLAAARDRSRVRIAQEDWHDARDAIAEREQWMARVVELGTAHLLERPTTAQRRAELGALAREAVARLPAGAIELVVDEAAANDLDDDWRAALAASRGGDPITIVTAAVNGGCLARSADGRAAFDNRYAARAERLQAQWRAELAAIYERATSAIALPRAEAP